MSHRPIHNFAVQGQQSARQLVLQVAQSAERLARGVARSQLSALAQLDQEKARADLSNRLQRAQSDVRHPEIWFPGFDQ